MVEGTINPEENKTVIINKETQETPENKVPRNIWQLQSVNQGAKTMLVVS